MIDVDKRCATIFPYLALCVIVLCKKYIKIPLFHIYK